VKTLRLKIDRHAIELPEPVSVPRAEGAAKVRK